MLRDTGLCLKTTSSVFRDTGWCEATSVFMDTICPAIKVIVDGPVKISYPLGTRLCQTTAAQVVALAWLVREEERVKS